MKKILTIDPLELIYTGIMFVLAIGFWLAMLWHEAFIPWLKRIR